ncbi:MULTISPECIES: GxxExxY protein [Chryseobacterium]|uniref:GxxExxY protein n=1 Tax=Chryseobacterium rhizosphaerae TaxID=395937 RepID=A0AAE3Y5Y6_9FLAO|nr:MULTISPECIES: GxxExxY protein [Chryseobacterium]MBL3546230.1 GxxExxY protein [Chryseobacterium sp. KMC2]MDR6526018.1 GxxExxY protein [Chryseobacterium rhizosphaerae]MDR6548784.1 GxxExxY protein [Chryseobacterium rhizosphaerae]
MTENELSYKIIGAAIEVHKTLGVGLLESAYEAALVYELKTLGLNVKQQISLPLTYKEITIENAYKIDLIVDDKVIIEVKSVLELHPIFHSQVLTYLKQANIKLGLLINFNNELIKYGIHRIVNKLINE